LVYNARSIREPIVPQAPGDRGSLQGANESRLPFSTIASLIERAARNNSGARARRKMMLGPCRGGAVRLGALGSVQMVGEGIENCLVAMQATGRPALAALSTSGLRTLSLPADVREIVVLLDGDDASEAASRDAAMRWQHEGRRVRFARPPRGFDFNDVLLGRTVRHSEDVR
jgi:putative DNA primase/helicase